MAKAHGIYRCQACGGTSQQWLGRCPACGEWNSLEQEVESKASPQPQRAISAPLAFPAITTGDFTRFSSGIAELDRVLGGGIVAGSLVLVGGDPGIGKSTLMLQMSSKLAEGGSRVLYVSGEESAAQLKLRGERLKVSSANLLVQAEVLLENIREGLAMVKPELIVIDSIQAVYTEANQAPPGTVSQVRQAAQVMMEIAKGQNIPVFVVGHVTKDGYIAGPKVLEHMVDTVLYFEGQDSGAYRLLRAVKNRFGSTDEIGVFEMRDCGMAEIPDPSALFLSGANAPGCAVTCTMEGTRPMLAEVQSLISASPFSNPRRMAAGLDLNRLILLLAVLEKKAFLSLSDKDVYINVVGGLRLEERAGDLAAAMCVASSLLEAPLPPNTACIGEVSLTGEIRPVSRMDKRVGECARLGYTSVIAAKSAKPQKIPGVKFIGVSTLGEAVRLIAGK
jgi:DNA repair protein RadA/Sms